MNKLLSIDPGSSTGIAISNITGKYNDGIYVTDTYKINNLNIDTDKYYGRDIAKYRYIVDMIESIYLDHNTDGIVIEDAYIHPRRPQAAYSVVSYVSGIIMNMSKRYNIRVLPIHNKVIKKSLGYGIKDKNDIRNGVLSNNNIIIDKSIDIHNLVEHEIDAIAVAYAYVHNSKII